MPSRGAANTAENRIRAPLRPDHGHELLDDGGRGTHPGYRLVGRLVGRSRGIARVPTAISAKVFPHREL
ncbi:hypothetical protein HFO56_42400 [Rhizobium laguerreae]|nr:hypothetical protein [Rhizobium laguerreae]